MLNKCFELASEILKSLVALERLVVPKECENNVRLEVSQPLVGRFKVSFAAGIMSEFGLKLLGTRKSPRRIPSGMRAEARGVSAITHVANKKHTIRITDMHFRFKVP